MNEQIFMKALGGVRQDMLDELAAWQEARKPIREGAAKSERLRGIRRNACIGAAVAACAVIAVSIGREAIGQRSAVPAGMTGEISAAEQLPVYEPISIIDYRFEGIDVAADIPADGMAQVLHSAADAQPWIELVRQSGEYGRETNDGCADFRTLIENAEIYQKYDLVIAAVPYHFRYSDYGIAMYQFAGAEVTKDGKLTVETAFLTVGTDMYEFWLQQIETICCCFAVPKNTVPEITAFQFHDVIYDCTDDVPEGCDTNEEQLEFLYSLPNYTAFRKHC